MGYKCDKHIGNFHYCTDEAERFIREWHDGKPYIEAHTSGSTGAPKTIHLLKRDMAVSAECTNRYFNIGRQSALYCPLSVDYIAGKMMIVRAILSGAELWMDYPSNNPQLPDCGAFDLIAVVPSQVKPLLGNRGGRNIGNLLIGGSALQHDIAAGIIKSGIDAYVSYGMTETCSHVALRKVSNIGDEIYEAMDDISFSTDDRGCLVIRSDKRSFGQLVTNDVVELEDCCHFRWLGRYDNVINSGGIKVFPEEIENQIRGCIPSDIEYYITKTTDPKWGETPLLVVSKDTGENEKLLERARNAVSRKAMRPHGIIVKDIARTSSGKIIRK